jgi:sterol desaturase/sphingolipid hydroxylase (fatty acid hydroxylase superfamily)
MEAPAALRKFGSGWVSGILAFVLGLGGFFLVLCLRLPGVFTMPEMQKLEASAPFHLALQVLLIVSFLLSAISLTLRPSKILGGCGVVFTLLAALLGGSNASTIAPDATPIYFGLDWFVLRVILTGLLFIPFERLTPLKEDQAVFRDDWREDLFYYFISSMMVQVFTFLTFLPAKSILAVGHFSQVRSWVGGLPFLAQFVTIMFLTDFVQYWVHRAFHRIPALWKFHAVHHSARSMDWIAGARMHFVEIVCLRAATVIPMFVLGFGPNAMNTYIFVVYVYATFVHANLGWRLGWLERLFVTPRFHHWHHGIEQEAVDVNFAIHFPLLDRIFGTYFLPKDRWPKEYGIAGHPVPRGYVEQFKYPFGSK